MTAALSNEETAPCTRPMRRGAYCIVNVGAVYRQKNLEIEKRITLKNAPPTPQRM